MAVNIRLIARELGLSTATVSRVLNNKPDVGAKTRERVLSHLKEREYAQPDREGPGSVGVVGGFSDDHFPYYFAEILQGIEPELNRRKMTPVLIRKNDLIEEYRRFGQVPLLSRLKGLVWIMPELDRECRSMVASHRLPCVCVNSYYGEPSKGLSALMSDNAAAAGECIDYLWGLGHRRIAFLGVWEANPTLGNRLDGCRRALEAKGGYREELFLSDLIGLTPRSGADGTARLMTGKVRPTAIIVASDHLVPGVYRGLKQLGYAIPRDVSVTAFDDFAYSDYLSPPLTTFRQPMAEMGARSVALLNGEGEQGILPVRMPFMVRESAGPPTPVPA